MNSLYPLAFQPVLKERVWGGRGLETLYGKVLPTPQPHGESWEVTDRPEGVSVIRNGAWAGKDLRWLLSEHGTEVMGQSWDSNRPFPLLIKILDARDKLSLQVHPPASLARELGGEPKTEMWYVAQADPGADIFVGLRHGVDWKQFEQAIQDGTVESCFHRIEVKAGDCMFLPSGRVHALGAGSMIFEIQQNSDTTYRVFDWNRVGLDGQPRELHLDQAMRSIDFQDHEPGLCGEPWGDIHPGLRTQLLVRDPLFQVSLLHFQSSGQQAFSSGQVRVLGVVEGHGWVESGEARLQVRAGDFVLLPAGLAQDAHYQAEGSGKVLDVIPGPLPH